MPTYQYACTDADCRHEFEQFQAFTDAALTECPVCGKRVRKVYGSVGVVFKGSGFYRTDNRDSKASSTAASSEGGKSGSDSGTTSTKSDNGSSSGSGKSESGKSGSGSSGSGGSASTSSAPKAAVAG